jgi:phage tail sheath protein FI
VVVFDFVNKGKIMAGFMLSPGVQVVEKDFTSIVPAVSTSIGAFAGAFQWGPVMEPVRVGSENELVARFGRPNNGTFTSFFSAANFLAYSNNLLVVRTDNSGQRNAVTTKTGGVASATVVAGGSLYSANPTVTFSAPQTSGGVTATGTATVVGGVITGITITEPGSGYTSATVTITDTTGSLADVTATITVSGVKINNFSDYQTQYENGNGVVGEFAAKYPGTLGNSLKVSMADSATYETWAYKAEFDGAPGVNELHAIVIDSDGKITGFDEGVVEKYSYLSKASNGRRDDGTATYYKAVLNNASKWVYWMDHPVGMNWGAEEGTVTFTNLTAPVDATLSGGVDDFVATDGNKMNGYALFDNDEVYDISLVIGGKASATVATYIINNVVEVRKDCLAFFSPEDVSSGEIITGVGNDPTVKVIAYRDLLPSTSYAVLDSGYKYQYDRYNDVYRWVPLNGDIAGLCARTDFTDDPWFSPAGYSRGQVKNVVKLAFNPARAYRDMLYQKGVNSVVSFPGQGTVLYGDKTLLAKPSAFDRINVRRLFIVLEKAIATAAKYQLFEFNDPFTRAQFRSMVEPFLRDVQGRRGVTDFRVVCDETNNTGEVIDGNRFVADLYIKPARSINFITLNFVAVRTGASFEEIGG